MLVRDSSVTVKAMMKAECRDKERAKGPEREPGLEKPQLKTTGEEERETNRVNIFYLWGEE